MIKDLITKNRSYRRFEQDHPVDLQILRELVDLARLSPSGLVPVLHGSRRMNCLGVILLPIACNMSGVGPRVAGWLGLL